jgi:hypothetical protein
LPLSELKLIKKPRIDDKRQINGRAFLDSHEISKFLYLIETAKMKSGITKKMNVGYEY